MTHILKFLLRHSFLLITDFSPDLAIAMLYEIVNLSARVVSMGRGYWVEGNGDLVDSGLISRLLLKSELSPYNGF